MIKTQARLCGEIRNVSIYVDEAGSLEIPLSCSDDRNRDIEKKREITRNP